MADVPRQSDLLPTLISMCMRLPKRYAIPAVIACSATAFLWIANAGSRPTRHELTSAQRQLYASLEPPHARREAMYGNGHFVWLETETTADDTVVTRVEYWARENRFFRIDKQTCRNDVSDPYIHRLIERPDGISRIVATHASDPGQVHASSAGCTDGRCAPPALSLRGQYFLAQANRLSTVPITRLMDRWVNGEYELTNFEILQNDSTACLLAFTRTVESGVKTTTVEMDPTDFRVRSWTYDYRSFDGRHRAHNSARYDYAGPNLEIPSRSRCEGTSNFDEPFSQTCVLVEHDLAPADAGLFVVPDEIRKESRVHRRRSHDPAVPPRASHP